MTILKLKQNLWTCYALRQLASGNMQAIEYFRDTIPPKTQEDLVILACDEDIWHDTMTRKNYAYEFCTLIGLNVDEFALEIEKSIQTDAMLERAERALAEVEDDEKKSSKTNKIEYDNMEELEEKVKHKFNDQKESLLYIRGGKANGNDPEEKDPSFGQVLRRSKFSSVIRRI